MAGTWLHVPRFGKFVAALLLLAWTVLALTGSFIQGAIGNWAIGTCKAAYLKWSLKVPSGYSTSLLFSEAMDKPALDAAATIAIECHLLDDQSFGRVATAVENAGYAHVASILRDYRGKSYTPEELYNSEEAFNVMHIKSAHSTFQARWFGTRQPWTIYGIQSGPEAEGLGSISTLPSHVRTLLCLRGVVGL